MRGYLAEDRARHHHIESGRRYYLPHWCEMVASGYLVGFGFDPEERPGYAGVYADPVMPWPQLPMVMPEAPTGHDTLEGTDVTAAARKHGKEERNAWEWKCAAQAKRDEKQAAREALEREWKAGPPLRYADVLSLLDSAGAEARKARRRDPRANPWLHLDGEYMSRQWHAYRAAIRVGLLTRLGPNLSSLTPKGRALLGERAEKGATMNSALTDGKRER